MEHIIQQLEELKLRHPTITLIEDTLSNLHGPSRSWPAVRDNLHALERDGIWVPSTNDATALQALKMELDSHVDDAPSSPKFRRNISIVQPPPQMKPHPLIHSLAGDTLFPLELLDLLSQTHFLHLLANDPEKILPPGKSLLSVLSKPHAQERRDGELPTLQEKVEEVIHKAFWDEALEALSSSEPSVQLRRLKLLYNDLHVALEPLLPPNHVILITLSSPLSPTSSPLLSAMTHLREIIIALRQRCAPARDLDLDTLLGRLDDTPAVSVPQLVIDTIRSILKLAEVMKDDLSQFVLGTMGEGQLKAAIREQAKIRERELVLEVWKDEDIKKKWESWMKGSNEDVNTISEGEAARKQYLERLMQALCGATPVFCAIPTKPPPGSTSSDDMPLEPLPEPRDAIRLPPVFFFSIPELVFIQNFLQTIVIVACLRALLPPTATSVTSSNADSPSSIATFTSRIFTLLLASIDAPTDDSTKLINLADELVRAAGTVGPSNPDDERRLRNAVDRTLRMEDPVFTLLQQRVVRAMVDRLLHQPRTQAGTKRGVEMRTGRDTKGKRIHVGFGTAVESSIREDEGVGTWDGMGKVVKGFEDLELTRRVDEVTRRLARVLEWLDEVWGGEISGEFRLKGLDMTVHGQD